MALPNDSVLQHAVMRLIGKHVGNRVEMHLALPVLELAFPCLTPDETDFPFGTSASHFANRVQWAVAHLKADGWLEMAPVSGTGYWMFTPKAKSHWNRAFPDGDELLAELLQ